RLSRATMRKMRQNLVWATGYNVVAPPLAAGVLAGSGVVLQPAWGALAMGGSTLIVAINGMLLRRLRLRPHERRVADAGTRRAAAPGDPGEVRHQEPQADRDDPVHRYAACGLLGRARIRLVRGALTRIASGGGPAVGRSLRQVRRGRLHSSRSL